jgi:hypothetical protein
VDGWRPRPFAGGRANLGRAFCLRERETPRCSSSAPFCWSVVAGPHDPFPTGPGAPRISHPDRLPRNHHQPHAIGHNLDPVGPANQNIGAELAPAFRDHNSYGYEGPHVGNQGQPGRPEQRSLRRRPRRITRQCPANQRSGKRHGDAERPAQIVKAAFGRRGALAHRYRVSRKDGRDGQTEGAHQQQGQPDPANDGPRVCDRIATNSVTQASANERNASTITQPWRPIAYSLMKCHEGTNPALMKCSVASKITNVAAPENDRRPAVREIAVTGLTVFLAIGSSMCLWFH